MTDRLAADLAAALLGLPVGSATEVPASAEHQVFQVQRSDGVVAFLKVAGAVSIKPEVAVLQLLANRGVAVPVIVAADPDGTQTGIPCVLIGHVGGKPLSHESREFAAAGKILRQVHDISLNRYGSLTSDPAGLHGKSATWQDVVADRLTGLKPIAEAGLVEPALLARAIAAVKDNAQMLSGPEPGRLLHGDFHPRHVYADNGRITGIIDWSDASCGDPLYDFGRILHSAVLPGDLRFGVEAVSQVQQTYGDAPWLPADPTRQILVYGVMFTLTASAASTPAGPHGRHGGPPKQVHSPRSSTLSRPASLLSPDEPLPEVAASSSRSQVALS
ncbi:MAG: phosphotransferase family protein [Streptosporangiaceae bacterium]